MNEKLKQIHNADFDTASQMLDEWTANRDAASITLALTHPSLILRKEAAKALEQVGDARSVPSLIAALEESREMRRGGAETEILQSELNAALVSALQELTGMGFGVSNEASEEEIRHVVELSRQWWEKNKN